MHLASGDLTTLVLIELISRAVAAVALLGGAVFLWLTALHIRRDHRDRHDDYPC